ncbi:MAG: hypothetical protein ACE15D_10405 [Candidatus Eisenbacteria bacterium]
MRARLLVLPVIPLLFVLACGDDEATRPDRAQGQTASTAVIVGTISEQLLAARGASAGARGADCPDAVVTLNGSPASVRFDEEDCSFLVSDIEPSEVLVVRIELPELGMSGSVTIDNVDVGELIEISVETGHNGLAISVTRRERPSEIGSLPEIVEDNRATFLVHAGFYDQGLTVRGNKFTLVGEAGDDCSDIDSWTVLAGPVVVEGNNATFRNVSFEGPVQVLGNNARFIHCCIGGSMLLFGNNTDIHP